MSEPTLLSMLPAPVAAGLAQARAIFFAISRPARILIVATSGLALLFGTLAAVQRANEAFEPLFTQLDRDDAAAIVAKLKEQKIAYKLGADGASVEVAESKLHELRLELAGAGLPRGGGVGFESFDKMRLGATDFEQRVLYRRALEGELTRTIATLGAVESSRVHLVLPEKSVFVGRSEPASASIVLRLRPGRTLGESEVASVVHLVSAAVPSLEADRIAVVTTGGTTLHRPRKPNGGDTGLDGEDDARAIARSYESSVEDRVRAMLERVVGPGHADVRVTADIDSARVERVEDHYDPATSALRSDEQSTESHTRKFELDHISEKRVTAGGGIRRLTVAVVLDGVGDAKRTVFRSAEDLGKLATLVRSAAGSNDARGDVVTVESMPFAESGVATEPAVAAATGTPEPTALLRKWAPSAAAGLLIFAVVVVAAPRKGRALRAPNGLRLENVVQASVGNPLALESPASPVLDSGELRARAISRAAKDPANAALVLRLWLSPSAPDVQS